ncbi:MAG: metallopeptidase TldD-related protein [Candidatus Hatepunaea meridiana]|nr:metallopeptidase TldD-related protein [Candidatus Hatepunaea meridiana]
MINHLLKTISILCLILLLTASVSAKEDKIDILDIMQIELDRSIRNLTDANEIPLYHLAYSVTEGKTIQISANDGGLESPKSSIQRYLDVDLRVGNMEFDNTREIRGGNWRDNYSRRRMVNFPLDSQSDAIRSTLWSETEYQYRKAQERYSKVLTNRQVKVEEINLSDDFSPFEPQQFVGDISYTQVDINKWNSIIKRISEYLTSYPFVFSSSVRLMVNDKTIYFVSSEGSSLCHTVNYVTFGITVNGMAEDGMKLRRTESWNPSVIEKLPDEKTIKQTAERLVNELKALIDAPIVEPFIGPAILVNRASGVFFHEIFGHRIEGQSQKSESDGQTFTKKVSKQILPEFISVYDDPTLSDHKGNDLSGHYLFDDEGTPAQKVTVVENGILKSFLLGRSPLLEYNRSNGHGRRQAGYDVVSRQGNLIVKSTNTVPFDRLREMLIEECKKQGKDYGLIFEDISGGFTMTGRWTPQAFKVIPLLVSRVYADGRPDEYVRGVDIVGTPLTSFSKILITGDDDDIFNGMCGAASGMVPVSSVSPSILVSEIEVQKRSKGQEKPPILPPPGHLK